MLMSAASAPPESRGLARDEVRLLCATPAGVSHHRFRDLPSLLAPGDLLVVNRSATLPAAVRGRRMDGRPVAVHFSTRLTDHVWSVEVRPSGEAYGPVPDAERGEVITLAGGASLQLGSPYTAARREAPRLWQAEVATPGDIETFLADEGHPIRYGYLEREWPLAMYQTVFADAPGSAEMPSAGRPFSEQLVTALVRGGVTFAPIVLHTGVSSLESGEGPYPEWYDVPVTTGALINATHDTGRRVIAVGTTVVRALETAAREDGVVVGESGWTDLVLGRDRPARVVDGVITGWHDSGATHLQLLEAVAGTAMVESAYSAAGMEGYLRHEFGDSCLLLPG